ncbi:hypothetical protein [Rhodococcoides yunnanense]|uniref:hypothetical protein n=1 Tax=Rhodococcoides yunnanense TaxID=278209 RepID=UPI001114EE77|nr:hypothetical protein [Rhodococcus yunnanensis]
MAVRSTSIGAAAPERAPGSNAGSAGAGALPARRQPVGVGARRPGGNRIDHHTVDHGVDGGEVDPLGDRASGEPLPDPHLLRTDQIDDSGRRYG